jgi:hypothetical protein
MRMLGPGQKPAEDEKRQRTLRRISRWVTRLLQNADLTPSDAALALVLVATMQRQARRCKPSALGCFVVI